MSKRSFWDNHDPLTVIVCGIFLLTICAVVIAAGIATYNAQQVWHDTGYVQSVGHMNSWDGNMWVTQWNATFVTQNHGTITQVQQPNCGLSCPSIPWTALSVNETIGIIRTNGGQYSVQELT